MADPTPAPTIVAATPPASTPPPPVPGFAGDQLTTIGRLSTTMAFLSPLFLLVGVVRILIGGVDIWHGNWGGLLVIPAGALLAFAGLVFMTGSADAHFLQIVKGRENRHLANTLESARVAFAALLIFGCYEAVLWFIAIWA